MKNPTQQSWAALGRLVGYLRETEYFAVRMDSKQQGTSFMQSMMDVDDGSNKIFLKFLQILIGVVQVTCVPHPQPCMC